MREVRQEKVTFAGKEATGPRKVRRAEQFIKRYANFSVRFFRFTVAAYIICDRAEMLSFCGSEQISLSAIAYTRDRSKRNSVSYLYL